MDEEAFNEWALEAGVEDIREQERNGKSLPRKILNRSGRPGEKWIPWQPN
jgi:hypothetical protein